MLSPDNRLRDRADFTLAVRRGRRAGRPLLAVHLWRDPAVAAAHAAGVRPAPAARAGLVVSKAVGGSVARTRVSRRLRHQLRDLVTTLPAGSLLVVRAQPPAARATSAALRADLVSALARVQT